MPNTVSRRRRRMAGEGTNVRTNGNLFLVMAAVLSILRTNDAFHTPSGKTIGATTRRKPSLRVLSNPRRRTSGGNNSNIPSPIMDFEARNPLLIDLQKITIAKNSSPFCASAPAPRKPVGSTHATSVKPLRVTKEKAVSYRELSAGAASTSGLFRAKSDNTIQIVYPSPSTIATTPAFKEQMTRMGRKAIPTRSKTIDINHVKTGAELDRYWPDCEEEDIECPLPMRDSDNSIDYNRILKGISVKGDTQIIGSKDHPDFMHPVIKAMYKRKREQERQKHHKQQNGVEDTNENTKEKEKIALVVEGGGMRGCVSAGMVCAIHCLGLSDTIDIVYGSSAGAVIAAYFVSRQLPYFGPEVYYDALTTNMASQKTGSSNSHFSNQNKHHIIDRYENNYFIDAKRMTRSIGLGLCDPRLIKDIWTRRHHGKPMMNLHYMFQNVMLDRKPIDYETFIKRQKIQPLKVVATGLSSEKPFILSHEDGHFDSIEDLCHSLHASCLLPGIAGPVMNVKKNIPRGSAKVKEGWRQKPNFFLRNIGKRDNSDEYEPLADAMLSAPIPYDIAHKDGATHVLVIRSSPDGTNLLEIPSIVAWMGARIYKRYFLKKNYLPGMYKRSQTEQRHQRIYAKTILELNERSNKPIPDQDQTMTIALEPGSDEVSHLETTREGIFQGVRQGFARAYDALIEDPQLRGKGKEMALRLFPDEILDYDPTIISSLSNGKGSNDFQSAFEQYLDSTGVVPRAWETEQDRPPI